MLLLPVSVFNVSCALVVYQVRRNVIVREQVCTLFCVPLLSRAPSGLAYSMVFAGLVAAGCSFEVTDERQMNLLSGTVLGFRAERFVWELI